MKSGSKIILVFSITVLLLAFAGVVFVWAFGAASTPAVTLTAQVNEVTGQVAVQSAQNTAPQPAVDGMQLAVGDQVSTGSDGRARVDLSNGTIVRLSENTAFQLVDIGMDENGGFTRLKVNLGQLWVILAGGSLQTDTPSGVASVRGSYLSVDVDPGTGGTFITCLEGLCSAQNDAGNVDMIAGDTANLSDMTLAPKRGFMTKEMIMYWIENNPEATKVVPAVTATVRATLPEVVLPNLACLDGGNCIDYCLPGGWDMTTGKIPALEQIPQDCIEGLFSFVWQGVNPETFFVCLAVGGSPQSCANNSVRRVFPIDVPADQEPAVQLPDLACLDGGNCATYCVPQGWDPNSGEMPSLNEIPLDCLQAANSLLKQNVDPWLFIQCVYVYGDVPGCAQAAVSE